MKKPLILVPIPGPKISIGNGNPVITTVGSQITEIAFVEISLTCPTQGSPPPKVTWKKDGKELVSGNGYVIDDKGTLTVLEALTKDSGRYTCLAQNAAGKEEVTSPIDVLGMLGGSCFTSQALISPLEKNTLSGVNSEDFIHLLKLTRGKKDRERYYYKNRRLAICFARDAFAAVFLGSKNQCLNRYKHIRALNVPAVI